MTPSTPSLLRARLPSLPLRELPAALRALGHLPSEPAPLPRADAGWRAYRASSATWTQTVDPFRAGEVPTWRADPHTATHGPAAGIREALRAMRGEGAHVTQEQIADLASRLGIPLK